MLGTARILSQMKRAAENCSGWRVLQMSDALDGKFGVSGALPSGISGQFINEGVFLA